MPVMRDIFHPREPERLPDRPPRPGAAKPPRRKAAALGLAALLTIALLVAGVATVAATFSGIQGASFSSLPFSSVFSQVSETYRRFMGMAGSSIALVKIGTDALALAPDLMRGERGAEFLELLARAETELKALGGTNLIPELGARGADLGAAAGALRTWLNTQDERRVVVVFGNSAEMRAGGGFIGSYAEVRLKEGAVAGITVRDINDADTGSPDRTIPPVPLEPVADRWRAADANWFLSGPETGAAFLTLLNSSPLYEGRPVDAVVFIAPRVASELLSVTGPLTAGGVAVDGSNFLRVIQEEVQEGQAAGAESPKAVLTALVPVFMDKLLSEATTKPLDVLGAVRDGVGRRDIVAYATDPVAQRALETIGLSGSLYPTDQRFLGGYVAVAPSTIGGDKTDAVTDQLVTVREQILPSGLVETEVAVERTHRGTEQDAWWYQEEHRSYVKVYAPEGSIPTKSVGVWQRDRDAATYGSTFKVYEPLRASVATTRAYDGVPGVEVFEETGKTVFGFWQRTARGTGSVAGVTYARELQRPLAAGDTYTFVLERQPASTASYAVEVYAPPGLAFAATGTSRWEWKSDDPDGRTVTPLELIPAP